MKSSKAHRPEQVSDTSPLARPRQRTLCVRQVARCAALTLVLSLPQGMLALPIAVAYVGLPAGLLILAVVGVLNVVTVAWTARLVANGHTSARQPPSLSGLAAQHLGPSGRVLAIGSSSTLFFLALLASLVGLGRSLAALTHGPAPALTMGIGLLVLGVAQRQTALGTRLLSGLGGIAVALLGAIILLALPQLRPSTPMLGTGSPLLMLGVSQMLFFAPMLVPTVAQQGATKDADERTLVLGSAAGVAAGALLAGLWAVAVVGVIPPAQLAAANGTMIPLLGEAVPAAKALALLLELLLLGLTALRCACILRALAAEHLPVARRWRSAAAAQLPAVAALTLAIAALLHGAVSFTILIAIAGSAAASLLSLVLPALLTFAAARRAPSHENDGRVWRCFWNPQPPRQRLSLLRPRRRRRHAA